MKIKHILAVLALSTVLLVSACSGGEDAGQPEQSLTPSPTQTTDDSDSVVIPTPSPIPAAYEGEQKTYSDLLAALKKADPSSRWTQSNKAEDKVNNSEVVFVSKDYCYIYGYPSFQKAVDNDFGSWFDYWTTLGSFGQLGIIMIDKTNCAEKTSSEISYPSLGKPGADSKVLTASVENINDCLVTLSACFLGQGVKLPEPSTSSYNKNLTELDALAKANSEFRFCLDPYFTSGDYGGTNSCEASTDIAGIREGDLITEVATDLDVLRLAAQSPALQSAGKYMIYGDGWAVIIFESTEQHKKAFIEMNKVIKGTLIARY